MPFEPFRFIHAANLALDHQLRGAGPLPDDIRRIVEDSTLLAFEEVISACIDNQVDFLLLTGNSFVEQDRSVRARVALQQGFDRLAEHDIRVFVMPGSDDPPKAWQAMGRLPDNVTPFFSRTGEAVAVIRDSKVIASVTGDITDETATGDKSTDDSSRFVESRRTPFTIGLLVLDRIVELEAPPIEDRPGEPEPEQHEPMAANLSVRGRLSTYLSKCPVDYVALGGGTTRQAIALEAGIAHNPGGTQGLSPRETGPHGCTLVDVDPDGTLQSTFLPTAVVRWEWFEAKIDSDANRDELAELMRGALAECRPEANEKVCLVNWSIHGSGPLFESLCDEEVRGQLIDSCAQNPWGDRQLRIEHTFRLVPTDAPDSDDPLLAEYFELLEGEAPLSGETIEQCLEQVVLPDTEWSGRLQVFADELNHAAIIGHARRLGAKWLAKNREEEPAS